MDALNLAQKVYNMLNRIAVSGGSYRDWLETVYVSGQYIERCETPTFEGGTSQEIVFQEVVSNSATEDEPLGTLAGRGVNAGKQKGGTIAIADPLKIYNTSNVTLWVTQQIGHSPVKMTVNEIGQGVWEENEFVITANNVPANSSW